MGVDNKIRSSTSKTTVVYHDWLKRGQAPADNDRVVCLALELVRYSCAHEYFF